jgi:geranylgeranyl diphosphate synthase, type II
MTPADVFAPAPTIDRIERLLREWAAAQPLPPNLVDAISYSLLAPGKRIRPILAWHAAVAVGEPGEASLDAGLAVELVHCFSLVHDDLPAMDDDDLRRGKPTLHIHAGEAMAILAGDAMLALAFGALAQRIADPACASRLVRELATGTSCMIAGQVYDTLGGLPNSLPPRERVELIHRNKTGALIRASCVMGALAALGCTDDPRIPAIERFADEIGQMFQIVDDLIDVEQTAEHAGKRTGKDSEGSKLTYPAVYGVQASRRLIDDHVAAAGAALDPLGPPAAGLRAIAAYLARRTR